MNLLTEAAGGGMGLGITIGYIVIIIAIMYFLAISPQKKEQKRLAAMLSELSVGDSHCDYGRFLWRCDRYHR